MSSILAPRPGGLSFPSSAPNFEVFLFPSGEIVGGGGEVAMFTSRSSLGGDVGKFDPTRKKIVIIPSGSTPPELNPEPARQVSCKVTTYRCKLKLSVVCE